MRNLHMLEVTPSNNLSKLRLGFVKTNVTSSEQDTENRTLSFQEFSILLSTATVGLKDGPYLLRGPCHGHRSNKNMTEAYVLVIDGDSSFNAITGIVNYISAPPIVDAHNVLKHLGLTHVIHTSHSHFLEGKGNRWRAYIPTSRPYTQEEIEVINSSMHKLMQEVGCNVVQTNESGTFSQPWYMPRKATEDALFEHHMHVGNAFDVDAVIEKSFVCISGLSAKELEAFERLSKQKCPTEITLFNATHSMAELLSKHGYKKSKSFGHNDRWIHLNSNSGQLD